MQEDTDLECGKYIGEVREENGILKKVFQGEVGKVSHNSKEMVEKRNIKKQIEEEYKKERIERLQKEINELNK